MRKTPSSPFGDGGQRDSHWTNPGGQGSHWVLGLQLLKLSYARHRKASLLFSFPFPGSTLCPVEGLRKPSWKEAVWVGVFQQELDGHLNVLDEVGRFSHWRRGQVLVMQTKQAIAWSSQQQSQQTSLDTKRCKPKATEQIWNGCIGLPLPAVLWCHPGLARR